MMHLVATATPRCWGFDVSVTSRFLQDRFIGSPFSIPRDSIVFSVSSLPPKPDGGEGAHQGEQGV